MKRFLKVLNNHLSNDEILNIAKQLNKSYYAYMLDSQVWKLLYDLFPVPLKSYLNKLESKEIGHNIVNDILMNFYPCERLIKYYLVRDFIKNSDETTIFEMRVENSRLDIGRINGFSHVYEIKTELDSLNKLEKQVYDYSKVFEYITIVAHQKHIKKITDIVPTYCGIYSYELKPNCCKLNIERKEEKNPFINTSVQIDTLTSKDLEFIIDKYANISVPAKRFEREKIVSSKFNSEEINYFFKEAIKNRYYDRWNYIRKSFNKINPIDIQELYTGPIDPKLIYVKNSSMVVK